MYPQVASEIYSLLFQLEDLDSMIALSQASSMFFSVFKNILNEKKQELCTIISRYDYLARSQKGDTNSSNFVILREIKLHGTAEYEDLTLESSFFRKRKKIYQYKPAEYEDFILEDEYETLQRNIADVKGRKMLKLYFKLKETLIDCICERRDKYELFYPRLQRLNQDEKQCPSTFSRLYGPLEKEIILRALKREKGDVFLYPLCFSIRGLKSKGDEYGRNYSYGYEDPEVCGACWIASKYCDNWPRHYHKTNIDEHLPIKLFYGKKEGDSILFSISVQNNIFHMKEEIDRDSNIPDGERVEIKLTLRQSCYRYGSNGRNETIKFEDQMIISSLN